MTLSIESLVFSWWLKQDDFESILGVRRRRLDPDWIGVSRCGVVRRFWWIQSWSFLVVGFLLEVLGLWLILGRWRILGMSYNCNCLRSSSWRWGCRGLLVGVGKLS